MEYTDYALVFVDLDLDASGFSDSTIGKFFSVVTIEGGVYDNISLGNYAAIMTNGGSAGFDE